MAKEKAHVHRIPKSHKIAAGMKPGESMALKLKMLDPDEASEGDEGTYPMEEESAEMQKAAPAPKKKVDPIQAVKEKRAMAK